MSNSPRRHTAIRARATSRIELRAGRTLHFGDGVFDRALRLIGATRGHGFEGVRASQNAGLQRYLVALESVRVALPVRPFVMRGR